MTSTPEQTALSLIRQQVSIEDYLEVQEQRKARLHFWEKEHIDYLYKKEKELVDFGESVLALLRAYYSQN